MSGIKKRSERLARRRIVAWEADNGRKYGLPERFDSTKTYQAIINNAKKEIEANIEKAQSSQDKSIAEQYYDAANDWVQLYVDAQMLLHPEAVLGDMPVTAQEKLVIPKKSQQSSALEFIPSEENK